MKKRWIVIGGAGLLLALAVLAAALINAGVVSTASQYTYGADEVDGLPAADCVLVPGALVFGDERLSDVLRDRMDTAIAIYEAGKAGVLLLSGDHGQKDYDEVNAMMDYAISKGVPKEDIFLDHAGFSTYESMYRARDVFCVESVIIVTQQVNLHRAVYDARKLGLEAYGVNADSHVYGNEKQQALREVLARVKDYLYVNVFLPEPKYLGDAIPIWGSSALTHDKA
jgi:vancomycin permeability regulator SanA